MTRFFRPTLTALFRVKSVAGLKSGKKGQRGQRLLNFRLVEKADFSKELQKY